MLRPIEPNTLAGSPRSGAHFRRRWAASGASLVCSILIAAGCARHHATSRNGDLLSSDASQTGDAILSFPPSGELLDATAQATFPTAIAAVRVGCQGRSYDRQGHPSRVAYSVITTRDVEIGNDLTSLQTLPQVSGVAPLNALSLPGSRVTDEQLRQIAQSMKADMLLMYTLQSSTEVDEHIPPLSLATLGLFPQREIRARCTAAAVLVDSQTGYIYGVAEASDRTSQMTNAWTTTTTEDQTVRRVEKRAFSKLLEELVRLWQSVLAEHASDSGRASSAPTVN